MSATSPPRQGPRPLPLHLANAIATWLSSRAALPLLKSGSLPLRPEFASPARALRESLGAAADKIDAALDRELRKRAGEFLAGIERYRHHPYRRDLPDPPVLWQEGTTRLLDYGPAGAPPLLVVPSLINRAYILDLTRETSLMRFLATAGVRPLLVDWGAPGFARARLRPHRVHRRPARGGLRCYRSRGRRAARRHGVSAWAACWPWRSPSGGRGR